MTTALAGSDDGAKTWARCASLIGTCKLNGVNPQAYLTDTLSRNVDMHSMSLIDDLMPSNFTRQSRPSLVKKGNGAALTFEPVAVVSGLDDVAMVGSAIEENGGHFLVAKDRRPFGLALRRWRHVDGFIHVLTGG